MTETTDSAVAAAELDGLIQWHVDQIIAPEDANARTADALRELAALRQRVSDAEQREAGMRAAAERVVRLRVGDLPNRGWLPDNNATRLALWELAQTLAPPAAKDAE